MGYWVIHTGNLGQGVMPELRIITLSGTLLIPDLSGIHMYGYTEITAGLATDKTQWASKEMLYVCCLSCGAGNWLQGSVIDPG
eukprot:5315555-Ditylum_brightwellii.AAC.1